jgi:hypothetical protein
MPRSYATHKPKSGTDTRCIQALLGHASITTTIYTHLSKAQVREFRSPPDHLAFDQKGKNCKFEAVNEAPVFEKGFKVSFILS